MIYYSNTGESVYPFPIWSGILLTLFDVSRKEHFLPSLPLSPGFSLHHFVPDDSSTHLIILIHCFCFFSSCLSSQLLLHAALWESEKVPLCPDWYSPLPRWGLLQAESRPNVLTQNTTNGAHLLWSSLTATYLTSLNDHTSDHPTAPLLTYNCPPLFPVLTRRWLTPHPMVLVSSHTSSLPLSPSHYFNRTSLFAAL